MNKYFITRTQITTLKELVKEENGTEINKLLDDIIDKQELEKNETN